MNHEPEHNPGDHEDPLAGWSWSVGIIGTLLVIVIVLGVTALKNAFQRSVWDEVQVSREIPEVNSIRERDDLRLNGDYRVEIRRDLEDNETDHLVIPIDRAIELMAAEQQRNRNR